MRLLESHLRLAVFVIIIVARTFKVVVISLTLNELLTLPRLTTRITMQFDDHYFGERILLNLTWSFSDEYLVKNFAKSSHAFRDGNLRIDAEKSQVKVTASDVLLI